MKTKIEKKNNNNNKWKRNSQMQGNGAEETITT